jgi:hypothetical protein
VFRPYAQYKEVPEDTELHTNHSKNHKTHEADVRNCKQKLKIRRTEVRNSLIGFSRTNKIIPSDLKTGIGFEVKNNVNLKPSSGVSEKA